MASFAPFEPAPRIAVAVSGGPDSMAMLCLVDEWIRPLGGSVLALTVDHALRAESGAEAARVAAWAVAREIAHKTLRWTGDKPGSAIQATARDARYRLLADACAAEGILYLAVAHHADDQAETVLFRHDRRSGGNGMAGMPASRSLGPARLIRPLLGWPKDALVATCARFGQDFILDPSNSAERFARTGLRRRLAEGRVGRAALLAKADASAVARRAAADTLAVFLARIAEPRPDGAVLLDFTSWAAAKQALRRAALATGLRSVGGATFAPSRPAVAQLEAMLIGPDFVGATLGGCHLRRWRGQILMCRELGRLEPPLPLTPGVWQRWNRRFDIRIAGAYPGPTTVRALGARDYAVVKRAVGSFLPSVVGAALPAVCVDGHPVAVPALGWVESDNSSAEGHYLPLWPLSPETFTVVSGGPDIMSA